MPEPRLFVRMAAPFCFLAAMRQTQREREMEITISKQLESCQRHSEKKKTKQKTIRGSGKRLLQKWAWQQHSTPHFCCAVAAVACGMNAPAAVVVAVAVVVAAAHRKQKLKSENYKTFYLASLLLHIVAVAVVFVAAVSFMQS